MSFRTRLGLLVAAAVAVTVVAVSAAALWAARIEARAALDGQLDNRIAPLIATRGRLPELSDIRFFGRFIPRDVLAQVVAPGGTVIYKSHEVLPVPSAVRELADGESRRQRHLSDIKVDGVRLRVLSVAMEPGGALMVARPLNEVDDNLAGLRNTLAVVAVVGVAGAGLLGFVVAGRAIRPVRRLTDAARKVARTQDLDQPIEPERDDELGELARSFNAMLEALAQSRDQQQRLVTDAGHELRTPLTSIRTNIELLARAEPSAHLALDGPERRRMLDDVLFELDELTELVTELVELATDQRSQGEPALVDLAALADAVVERHRRRSSTEFATSFQPASVTANAALIERALSNLVDNAVKWSPAGEIIEVTVAADGDDAVVRVRDRGPGIEPQLRSLVFERFFRAPEARALPGSGLGLSIVDYVARSHDGTVAVVDTDGPGATVEFRLPLTPEAAPEEG